MADYTDYMTSRLDHQLDYFDSSAIKNQKRYKVLKRLAILCNILTTMTIALAFTVPADYKVKMGIVALVLSTLVLATYQLEEFENFGAKWEKFRLVAERLRSEKYMFLSGVGVYSSGDDDQKKRKLVETVERIIQGTDLSYFTLIVEPGKRIEKRLEQHTATIEKSD